MGLAANYGTHLERLRHVSQWKLFEWTYTRSLECLTENSLDGSVAQSVDRASAGSTSGSFARVLFRSLDHSAAQLLTRSIDHLFNRTFT